MKHMFSLFELCYDVFIMMMEMTNEYTQHDQ
ncbi:hypothetical protein J2736_001313 [Paenibacillus qinlingensis]|uniref:Uncharacterized protein n=1 Tax=Paenibacillus qinlingensis TaxID=1837343 RepID=A0ABU1NRQ1_9BACL|nr:hypothetical protein [Paenibacillus qinlingensis]